MRILDDVVSRGLFSGALAAMAAVALAVVLLIPNSASAQAISFAEDVMPVLQLRCVECHQTGGDGFEKTGLDLISYAGLMKGTKHGPVVVPRSAVTSSLMAVLDHRTDKKIWMPHQRRKLSSCERRAVRFWINQGALNN